MSEELQDKFWRVLLDIVSRENDCEIRLKKKEDCELPKNTQDEKLV